MEVESHVDVTLKLIDQFFLPHQFLTHYCCLLVPLSLSPQASSVFLPCCCVHLSLSLSLSLSALVRLLSQLDETERAFDQFWARHQTKLTQCLQLRHFEHNYKEVSLRPWTAL